MNGAVHELVLQGWLLRLSHAQARKPYLLKPLPLPLSAYPPSKHSIIQSSQQTSSLLTSYLSFVDELLQPPSGMRTYTHENKDASREIVLSKYSTVALVCVQCSKLSKKSCEISSLLSVLDHVNSSAPVYNSLPLPFLSKNHLFSFRDGWSSSDESWQCSSSKMRSFQLQKLHRCPKISGRVSGLTRSRPSGATSAGTRAPTFCVTSLPPACCGSQT